MSGWAILLLALVQDEEIVDGKTFVSRTHNLTFSIPSAEWGQLHVKGAMPWKGWAGALVQGMDAGGDVGLCLTAEKADKTDEEYAKHFENWLAKTQGSKSVKRASESKEGDRLRVDFDWAFEALEFRDVAIFWRKDAWNYRLVLWVESKLWNDKKDAIQGIVASLKPFETTAPVEKVAHPWSACGEGSWVEHRITSKTGTAGSELTMKRTLLKKEAVEFTFKTETKMLAPTKMDLPAQESKEKAESEAGAKPKELGRGEEELEIAGKKLTCAWAEIEIDGSVVKTWTSDQVPGGAVKSVTKKGDFESTMLCIGFEKK